MWSYKNNALCVVWLLLCCFSAQAQPKAVVSGSVAADNGQVLERATVELVGTAQGTLTDAHGHFQLSSLGSGHYIVRASHLGYEAVVDSVELQSGEMVELHFVLPAALYLLEEVEVVGQLSSAQANALAAQRTAPNIKHVASQELFSRFPDRNAGETLQRLPGITLDRDQGEGEYVQVRGLNAQLNSVSVNGQRIPSPTASIEEGRAVGLNLLQIQNAESVEITKAITPDMDADALGGAVNMVLRRAPAEPEYQLNMAAGLNAQPAPFRSWGRDVGEVSASAGRRFSNDRLGLIAGVSLYRSSRGSLLKQVNYTSGDLDYNRWDNYDVRRQRVGLLGSADYRFSTAHAIRLNANYNIFLDDEIRRRRQYNFTAQEEQMEVRNRREDQRFYLLELSGEHRFSRISLDYSIARARASEELPDRTYFLFSRPHSFANTNTNDRLALGLEQQCADLDPFHLVRNRFDNKNFSERDHSARFDLEFPFAWRQSALKTGLKVWQKKKKAREQRWQYHPPAGSIETTENDYVFVDVHYDDERAVALFPLANYSPVQQLLNYDAEETIYAAYLMQTLQWTPRLSLVYGARYEETRHAYSHRASFEMSDERYANWLPSLHLKYQLGARSQLRIALTSGLSRPEYTRLLPITTPPDDGLILQGNPQLASTQARGIDLLFESFPNALGLLSAGFFAKRITDPIVTYSEERGAFTLLRPINGAAGTIWGVEFALTHHLRRYDLPFLRHAGLYANYTYSSAEMDYGTARADDGPLPGNARHTANLGWFYDDALRGHALTLSLNYRAPMLKDIGAAPDEDVWYEREIHVDFSARQELSQHLALFIKVNNLTNESERELFGNPYKKKNTRFRERETYGRSAQLGLSWTF